MPLENPKNHFANTHCPVISVAAGAASFVSIAGAPTVCFAQNAGQCVASARDMDLITLAPSRSRDLPEAGMGRVA